MLIVSRIVVNIRCRKDSLLVGQFADSKQCDNSKKVLKVKNKKLLV